MHNRAADREPPAASDADRLSLQSPIRIHPVPITRFSPTRFVPRVGLPRNLFLIGSSTAALRCSAGWVRKDLNLVMGIRCRLIGGFQRMNSYQTTGTGS